MRTNLRTIINSRTTWLYLCCFLTLYTPYRFLRVNQRRIEEVYDRNLLQVEDVYQKLEMINEDRLNALVHMRGKLGQLQVDIDKLTRVFNQLDKTLNGQINDVDKKTGTNELAIMKLAEERREMENYVKYKHAEELGKRAEVRNIDDEADYDERKPHNSITFV